MADVDGLCALYPASAETDLPLVEEGGPDDSVDSILDVGVIEDHRGVLTPQLQGDFLQGGGGQLGDPLSHLGGAWPEILNLLETRKISTNQ